MRGWNLVAVTALVFAGGCVNREAQQQGKRTEKIVSDSSVAVTLTTVETANLAETIDVNGEVATANDSQVGAKVPGRITAVFVKEGDAVRAGQLVASQDKTSLYASLRQAQAGAAAARAALAQAQASARIGPDRSASAVKSAEAQLRSAQTNLKKLLAGARDEERRQAMIGVQKAQSDLDTAGKELERVKSLYDGGAISKQRLEQAQNAFAAAQSGYENALQNQRIVEREPRAEDVSAAQEAIRQAEEGVRNARATQRLDVNLGSQIEAARANLQSAMAQVDAIQIQLRDADIVSPFAGRVFGRPVAVGTVVGAGTPVCRILGTDGGYFEGQVPETQLRQVQIGAPVAVEIDALGKQTFSGQVIAINPQSRELGRLFAVRIQIQGITDQVRQGMFARGSIQVRSVPSATVVSRDAVVTRGAENYVFTVEGEKAKRVNVTLGLRKNGLVQVTGLAPGQKVVLKGNTSLVDGSTVRVETADSTEGANSAG
ncbi:MAG: efflux RND transporter periplasmic adaptor subunit [Fimbriimonadaceae bacterium]|nr:efflux RND transporter periplasmic adaptor subunit [Fimbriimonadaceae bacterium]